MTSPDHALLLDMQNGMSPPGIPLKPLLKRHGILRGKEVGKPFTEWCRRIVAECRETGEIGPHRYWPSEAGALILAILPWQGDDVFAIQFFEEPEPREDQQRLATLTPREMEVLTWIAQGKGNADLSGILHLSEGTVRKHVEHILEKLMCENRSAAGHLYTQSWERYRMH